MTLAKGKVTYISAGALVVFGLLGLALGQLEAEEATQIILNGVAVFGLRRAVN